MKNNMSEQSKHTCQVFHFDLYGERENKYQFLQKNTLQTIQWQQLNPQAPQFFFVPKDFSLQKEYENGFRVDELMKVNAAGIKTHHDTELISTEPFNTEYNQPYAYRTLDNQWIDYDLSKVERHRIVLMKHLLKPNIALSVSRQCVSDWHYVFISEGITDINFIASAGKLGGGFVFPLYLYPEDGSLETERRANLDGKIWQQINAAIGREAAPEQVFDYIYGVLHSPSYRAKYKEFLKVDFPRIPYPASAQEFERYRNAGNRLRQLHLMHNLPAPQVTFPESGSMEVDKAEYRQGRVYINATQYFEGVPESAWNFYIGGYQPAQKWLKDRRGRTLSFEDVRHYQQIIYVLQETERIMGEIDNQQ